MQSTFNTKKTLFLTDLMTDMLEKYTLTDILTSIELCLLQRAAWADLNDVRILLDRVTHAVSNAANEAEHYGI